MSLLNVEGISKYYGTFKAVDDVTLSVNKGEILGVVGESGSGKTTLGRMMVGLTRPTKGRVSFCASLISSPERVNVTTDIQMVFQDPHSSLDGKKNVLNVVGEGLFVRKEKKCDIVKKVGRALETVGLAQSYAKRYPHEFSGGQRQRIAIARCMIMDPKLLIADEPISALDVSWQMQIISLIKDLCDKTGLSVVFITHDLGAVKTLCHRVAVMHSGRLVEMAPCSRLFEKPLHPYTKNLISCIPEADPISQRNKTLRLEAVEYNGNRQLVELEQGHFVLTDL